MTAAGAKLKATDRGANLGAKLPGMQLTERDLEILEFINTFGFCAMPQLEARFGWSKPRNYQIVKRLLSANLLIHEKILHARHGIYRLTRKGAGYTELPALSRITLSSYNHSLAVTDVYLYLRQKYPKAEWMSEREMVMDKYAAGLGKSGHLPDGILYLSSPGKKDQKIAVEVELRSKGKARLESIIKWYTSQFDFAEVWYFCPQVVANAVKGSMGEQRSKFIKVFSLKEIAS